MSGPLLDRLDMHIEVPRVSIDALSADRDGESSANVRRRVMRVARTIADPGGAAEVGEQRITEAIGDRVLDRQGPMS